MLLAVEVGSSGAGAEEAPSEQGCPSPSGTVQAAVPDFYSSGKCEIASSGQPWLPLVRPELCTLKSRHLPFVSLGFLR